MAKDYYIPGKKGPQRGAHVQLHASGALPLDDPEDPDAELNLLLGTPRMMVHHGTEKPFFGIGALARALNRSPGTIRKWHTAGIIPRPSFGAKTEALGGRVRLYSRQQIEAARQIAREEGILNDTSAAVTQTQFAARLKEVWA